MIDGLKLDLRIYVLVSSCDPLKIYVHKEGLVRFATKKYQPIKIGCGRKNLENLFVHLTNYSLNKDNANFINPESVEDEKAHKRTLTSVFKTLRERYGADPDKIWAECKDVIIKSMLTVLPDLLHNFRMC